MLISQSIPKSYLWIIPNSGHAPPVSYREQFNKTVDNFLDSRQSRWENLYSGTIQKPQFREVYTPTDGIIFNGGFKINL